MFIRSHARSKDTNSDSDHTDSKSTRPFFLYYAMPHMHAPQAFARKFQGSSSTHTIYGDALREMDNTVNVLQTALNDSGWLQDTLFIFTSDNGPWNIKCDWRDRWSAASVDETGYPSTDSSAGLGGSQGLYQGAWQRLRGGDTGIVLYCTFHPPLMLRHRQVHDMGRRPQSSRDRILSERNHAPRCQFGHHQPARYPSHTCVGDPWTSPHGQGLRWK